ncbi:MAG: hypothetical protein K2M50_02925 [Treponemataceae bacterium]|nr:hypothetical protein [Treponemataceae bacterium]
MNDTMQFADRESFRSWLSENCLASAGVWLLFGKAGGPKTLTAAEALEEALCFGWIDGKMQSIDDKTYKNIFPRAGKKASGRTKTSTSPKASKSAGL